MPEFRHDPLPLRSLTSVHRPGSRRKAANGRSAHERGDERGPMSTMLRKGLRVAPEAFPAGALMAPGATGIAVGTAPLATRRPRGLLAGTLLADLGTALAVVVVWQLRVDPVADPRALVLLPLLWLAVLAGLG